MKTNNCIHILRSSIKNGAHPEPPDARIFQQTSVMALFLFNAEPELLFIQKADIPGYPWANQMAFPGGHMDKTDASTRETALRELREEMQIRPENVEVIGSLGHFQTMFNKNIEAWVGIWNQKDEIRHDTYEISGVFQIPFSHLIKLHNDLGYAGQEANIMTVRYPYEDILIWGVTAKIVHHLIEILSKQV
ncbi:MAG: CoA pyrophosphatase [Proteobacteria bacterium]|nr:CoA pyrophosphatase [Pseudomonadota bacterium]MBU1386829.1 CoA pyrophosphatase [Pseudomonadota bacterium]MBU1544773.1 CoA pyrophosphatase [Pseudomonadota bacterium]MBU2429773.1 CoA pyrophosphatase [Pseudomonadota bacterium]MBU2481555.1 CoA pyrophosphatase [Pseudomonadota bacterium]